MNTKRCSFVLLTYRNLVKLKFYLCLLLLFSSHTVSASKEVDAEVNTKDYYSKVLDSVVEILESGNPNQGFEVLNRHKSYFKQDDISKKHKFNYSLLLAKTYSYRANYVLAFQEYTRLLAFAKKECKKSDYALVLIEFAEMQRKLTDFDKAKSILSEAYANIDSKKDHYNLAYYYNRIAAVYTEQNIIDTALMYSHKSIDISKKHDFYKLLGLSYNEIGFIHSNVPIDSVTNLYFDTAAYYSLKANSMLNWVDTRLNQFRHYMRMGYLSKAEKTLGPIYKLAEENNWKSVLQKYYMNKAWIAREKGDSIGNWKYSSRFYKLVNEISDKDVRNKIYEIKKVYDQKENLEKIEAQQKVIEADKKLVEQKRRENVYIFYVVIVLVVLVLVLSFFIFKVIGSSNALKKEREKLEQANVNLKHLIGKNDVLVKEIHHRVKNNMQIISSILGIQESYQSNEQVINVFQDARARVASMALVHQNLYETDNYKTVELKNYFSELINLVGSTFNKSSTNVRINLNIEVLEVSIDTAVPLALIVNEWLTNSYKYAFIGRGHGTIDFSIAKEGTNLVCNYSDDGVGIGDIESVRKGVGYLMVSQLKKQLFGEIEVKNSKAGLGYTLIAPLNRKSYG